jgi:hypothetical protein
MYLCKFWKKMWAVAEIFFPVFFQKQRHALNCEIINFKNIFYLIFSLSGNKMALDC